MKPITETYSQIEEMVICYIDHMYERYEDKGKVTDDDILCMMDALDVLNKLYCAGDY